MAFGDIVQSKLNAIDASGTQTISTTFDLATTAGNLLICVTAPDKTSGVIDIPSGFSLASQLSGVDSSGALSYKIADGTETTLTTSWAGLSSRPSQSIYEVDGPWEDDPLDVVSSGTSGSGTVSSLSTGTTGITEKSDGYSFAVFLNDTSNNIGTTNTPTNGFTERLVGKNIGGVSGQIVADKILTSVGTHQTTLGYSGGAADQATTFIATFKQRGVLGFKLLRGIEVPFLAGSPTASNVPMLVKPNVEFDAAMLAKLDPSGGDLRFGSQDGLTQYPCKIVDGLNVVWVLVPSVAAGNKIYVWGDKTGESQPAADSTYGSEAAWADYLHVYDFSTVKNSYSDETGSSRVVDVFSSGTPTIDTDGFLTLSKYDFLDIQGGQIPFVNTDALSLELDFKLTGAGDGAIFGTYTYPDYNAIYLKMTGGRQVQIVLGNGQSGGSAGYRLISFDTVFEYDTAYKISVEIPATLTSLSQVRMWVNGVEAVSGATAGAASLSSLIGSGANGGDGYLGYRRRSSENPLTSSHKSLVISKSYKGENYALIRHDNQSTAPESPWWIAEDAPSGSTPLTLQHISNPTTLDNITLNQAHSLITQSMSSGNSLDNVILTQASNLVLNSLLQGQLLNNVNLTQDSDLVINELLQNSLLGNIELSQANILALNELLQSSVLDNISLSQEGSISSESILQGNLVENTLLTQDHLLSVQESLQHNEVTEPLIISASILVVNEVLSGNDLESAGLSTLGVLSVAKSNQLSLLDTVTLLQNSSLVVDTIEQSLRLSAASVVGNYILLNDSLQQSNHKVASTSLEGGSGITVQKIGSTESVSEASLLSRAVLVTDNVTNEQSLGFIVFGTQPDLESYIIVYQKDDITAKYGTSIITIKFGE